MYFEGAEQSEHGGGGGGIVVFVELGGSGTGLEDGDGWAFCVKALGDEGPGSLNSSTSVVALPFKISEAACSSASIDRATSIYHPSRRNSSTSFCSGSSSSYD